MTHEQINVDSERAILRYLGLSQDYAPSPSKQPREFLIQNLRILPPHLLCLFSQVIKPQERTSIMIIRNRRSQYARTNPPDLRFNNARNTWPLLWEGRDDRTHEHGDEEKAWVESGFLPQATKHVGKLGALLAEYEEERDAERRRFVRREKAAQSAFVPEEDSDSDEEVGAENEMPRLAEETFLREIKERFIYGTLEGFEYDTVDWNDSLDVERERDDEDRYFDSD